ncbi:MAG: phosphatase PAP2 family protein [Rickettsiales bacterium]|nr:phosphatase PAP2 family protein [Rickettsiales bacterium]
MWNGVGEAEAKEKWGEREIRRVGDYLMVASPSLALGKTIYENDNEGLPYYLYNFLMVNLGTVLLQSVVREKRPTGDSNRSFPSGHASSAFSGATYVHFRYSAWEARWLYIMASFVAFSRVYAECHYFHDVLASAGLSLISSYFIVKNKNSGIKTYEIGYNPGRGELFLAFNWIF